MSDSHLDPHLQAEHEAPERTTPQGTQAEGLEHGHEGRDVIYLPIFAWFGGLAIFMGLALILLRATQGFWTVWEDREYTLPSPLFGQQRAIPEPRILPNLIDSGLKPMEHAQRYPETVPGEREREAKAAAKIGVQDPNTGEPILPDRAGTGGDGEATRTTREPMPSEPSGGTALEDRLR
jgi:hypothetical protein